VISVILLGWRMTALGWRKQTDLDEHVMTSAGISYDWHLDATANLIGK